MPRTEVVFYRGEDGSSPAYEALRDLLRSGQRRVFAKCQVRVGRLAELGHELRRPEADYVRDGVYELRVTHRRVHHRPIPTGTPSDSEVHEMVTPGSRSTTDALEILDRLIGSDAELRTIVEEEQNNAWVAREIRDLRTRRGLTQKQLAERVGTTQSVIARIEAADYEGHTLRMLRRVADALDARLTVHFVEPGTDRRG